MAAQIEKVREETKKKRKEMAMAMRMKQLSKLGMQVGKQGEVKVGLNFWKISKMITFRKIKEFTKKKCREQILILPGDLPKSRLRASGGRCFGSPGRLLYLPGEPLHGKKGCCGVSWFLGT